MPIRKHLQVALDKTRRLAQLSLVEILAALPKDESAPLSALLHHLRRSAGQDAPDAKLLALLTEIFVTHFAFDDQAHDQRAVDLLSNRVLAQPTQARDAWNVLLIEFQKAMGQGSGATTNYLRTVLERDGFELRSTTSGTLVDGLARSRTRAAPWNVPSAPEQFHGRRELLDRLDAQAKSGEARCRVCVLHGLGGIGKTQLVLEHVRRISNTVSSGWWIRSEDDTTRLTDFLAFGRATDLSPDGPVSVERVKHWLETNSGWLLIFDNAPNPAALRAFLPSGGGGRVLITTRHQGGWGSLGESLLVDTWSRSESVAFLTRRTADEDVTSAAAIAEVFGDLPLALEQAAGYADTVGVSLAEYYSRLIAYQDKLMFEGQPPGYAHTVSSCWALSLQEVGADSDAGDLLRTRALLAPELFDDGWFSTTAVAGWSFAGPGGRLALDAARQRLLQLSLVGTDRGGLVMHRLVGRAVRAKLPKPEERSWATVAQQIVAAAFPFKAYEVSEWARAEGLIVHLVAVTEHMKRLACEDRVTANLLDAAGAFLSARGDPQRAVALHARALVIRNRVEGDPRELAATLRNLGNAHFETGDSGEAQRMHERAWNIAVEAGEATGQQGAAAQASLATVLTRRGQEEADAGHLEAAHALYRRAHDALFAALKTFEGIGDDESVARTIGNYGMVLGLLGDQVGAQQAEERFLEMSRRLYGPSHPEVARALSNLGLALADGDHLTQAQRALEQALAIEEGPEVYGPVHPEVAMTLGALAGVYRRLGDFGAERESLQRALDIFESRYGANHFLTTVTRRKLRNA